jgi:phytoene synthase
VSEKVSLHQFTRTAERAADQVIASYSTSFGLATSLLGRRHRQHVRNIYAMVRVADELVDGLTAEAGLTRKQQSDALDRFIDETHRAMALGCSSDLIIHAFARSARDVGIDETLTGPFFASMRTDLGQHSDGAASMRFDTQSHADYVYGSAEVVGLMCLRVFMRDVSLSDGEAQALQFGAKQLGAAFQNINFLRDLSDDTERLGRSYLGTNDRLDDDDLNNWVRTIRSQLEAASLAIPMLPRDARAAVRSALLLFAALTDRVERVTIDELYRRRIRVPNARKGALAARALITTWREPKK